MNDLEKDIYNYIVGKYIDFYQTNINIDVNVDNYQFSLTVTLLMDDHNEDSAYAVEVKCSLLENYYIHTELSKDFKQSITDYFVNMITYAEDRLLYLIQLRNCLTERDIVYTA